jgi:adenosylcobinamide-GDP ribazoletransferase
MLLAPATVAPMALVLVLGHLVATRAPGTATVVAVAVAAAEALVTRAMHLDGLADTADGLSAGYDATSSLRAMKASDIGPSGVAAVVLVLLGQVASLAVLLPSPEGTALAVLAWLWSRHAVAWACRSGVPAAQPSGLGAMVAGSVPPLLLAVATLACTTVAAVVGVSVGAAWWHLLVGALAAVLAGLAVVARCRRRLGGVTGDVLGAVVEVALTAGLGASALAAAWPAH